MLVFMVSAWLAEIFRSNTMGSPLYSTLLIVGILIGAVYWVRVSKNDSRLPVIYIGGIVGAFIGAKLAFLFAEGWMYFDHPQRIPILLSGKSIIGALPGGWVGVEITKKIMEYRENTGDRFATILPISLILGRIGCLHAGCCGGITCSFGKWPAVPVEIGFQILAILVLSQMRKRSISTNQHFHLYLISYGIFRFFHEFLRTTPKPFIGLSGYQIIAILTAAAAMLAFQVRRKYIAHI
jgi:phosphatidylglycerol---prolipoprotein diacylglyceryl transferase